MIHHDTESRLLFARERADLLAQEWVPANLAATVEMRGHGFAPGLGSRVLGAKNLGRDHQPVHTALADEKALALERL